MKDWNICEHCNLYVPIADPSCPNCEQPLALDARAKIAIWRLGEISDGIAGNLAAGLREAFGISSAIQPAFLDERPSARPSWKGLSAGVFLAQVHRRHMDGAFVNLGITARNIVPDSKFNFLFGYAYMGAPAAVVSLYPLSIDNPSDEVLVARVVEIAVHEIGHTLGLDHHSYEDNVDCVMVGDEQIDSLETVDSGSPRFCESCREAIRRLAS